MKSPRRVVFIQKQASLGGAQVNLLHLLKYRNPNAFYPVVVVGREGFLTREIENLGVELHQFPLPAWRKPLERIRHPFWSVTLEEFFRTCGADLLVSNDFWYHPYGQIPARKLGVPTVCIVQEPRIGAVKAKQYLLHYANGILCVSQAIREHLRDMETAAEFSVINNGVDIAAFPPEAESRLKVRQELGIPADAFVIVMVGRLSARKSQHLLLEALPMLLQRIPEACALLVGEGKPEEEAPLREMAKPHRESVVFAGARPDISRILAASDVYAMLSTHEGQPLALLEAMAAERAIVYIPVPGVDELLDEEVAYPVRDREPQAVADALCPLAEDAGLRAGLGAAVRKRAEERFSVRSQVEKTYAFFERIIQKTALP